MSKRRWVVPQQGDAVPQDPASPADEKPAEGAAPPAETPVEARTAERAETPTGQHGGWSPPASGRPRSGPAPKQGSGLGPGRWILLVLLILAGAGSGVVRSEPLDATETAIAVFSGAIAAGFWWLVGGLVVWLIRLGIRRRRRFGAVMLAPALLGTMLGLFCVSAFGAIAINAREEEERIAAPSASAADTEDELSVEQEAMVDYINGFIRCAEGSAGGRKLESRFLKALERGDWSGAERYARREHSNISRMHDCLAALTGTGDAELEPLAKRNADAIGLMVSAYAVYVRATDQQDVEAFDVGDRRITSARTRSRRTARRIDALYRSRGGKRLARYIDFERLLRAREGAGIG